MQAIGNRNGPKRYTFYICVIVSDDHERAINLQRLASSLGSSFCQLYISILNLYFREPIRSVLSTTVTSQRGDLFSASSHQCKDGFL